MTEVKASLLAKALIKKHSELHLTRVIKNGDYMVGWCCRGVLIARQVPHSLTAEEAESFLEDKIMKIERVISQSVETPLTQSMFDALVCYIHSIGVQKWLCSRALKSINRRRYVRAAKVINVHSTHNERLKEDVVAVFLADDTFVFNTHLIYTRGRKANCNKFSKCEWRYY